MKAYPGIRDFDGYKYVATCKACRAKDWQGNLLRPRFEAMEVSYRRKRDFKNRLRQQEFLAERGVFLSLKSLQRHYTRHAKYLEDQTITKIVANKAKRDFISHISAEPRESLQRIINYADQMIENWWNDVEGAKTMEIDKRIYIEALKEDGRRMSKTRIDFELDMIEKEAIEGHSK